MLNPTFFSNAGGRWRRPGEMATRARWQSRLAAEQEEVAAEQAAARSRRWGARSMRAATRGTTAGLQARRLSRPDQGSGGAGTSGPWGGGARQSRLRGGIARPRGSPWRQVAAGRHWEGGGRRKKEVGIRVQVGSKGCS
ncbi:hypothetical protein PVAP13_5KG745001 [Panicum virgatum]|uniref:Uncharacterized protein n=1 Tax=Panicum virgatum TaxID=38727 RepID=A0A8T0T1F6_PANVG|nr:hypothetical protein PVAP13_5KG745001 [Panicum virgatum]